MAVLRPFGKRLSSRIVQGVFYVAWLSMVAGLILKGLWFDACMPLMLFSIFLMGAVLTFADREGLVDFFGPDTKPGRDLSDGIKAAALTKHLRILGILFMAFMLYLGFEVLRTKLVRL